MFKVVHSCVGRKLCCTTSSYVHASIQRHSITPWVLLLFKRLGTDAHQDWDGKHEQQDFFFLLKLLNFDGTFLFLFFFYILPHLPLSASTVWRFAITNSTYRCHQFNNDSGTSDATGMISMHFIKINSQLFFFLPSLGNTLLSPKLKTANLS